MKKLKKDNIVNFPMGLSEGEKEVEAILFAAAEPLDIDTIKEKISKKIDVEKTLIKLIGHANFKVFDVNIREPYYDFDLIGLKVYKKNH